MTIDMSALEADLNALPRKGTSARQCRVQALVEEHPEAAETLQKAIADLRYSTRQIASVLTKNGLPISEGTVAKHRKGECTACRNRASSNK